MTKYRVVIRTTAARRDAATAVLLGQLLERSGCAVLVTSTRDFENTLRLWKPHSVVVNTLNLAARARELCPASTVVFVDAEGFLPPGFTIAEWWSENLETLQQLDLALVWGARVVEECRQALAAEQVRKIKAVGNLKLDFVRFRPREQRTENSERDSIGVVCRFGTINQYEGIPPIRTIPNKSAGNNVERVVVEVYGFDAVVSAIHTILEKTRYRVSIRPHPLEQVESYERYVIPMYFDAYRDRIEVDTSLEFCAWAIKQKALVSPTSSTFLEAYLLGIPVINLDHIAGVDRFMRDYAPVTSEWQQASPTPKDVEALAEIVTGTLAPPPPNDDIQRQLAEYCDWENGGSACMRAAAEILSLLEATSFSGQFHWPRWLVDLRDNISFRRSCRRNPLHHNFNYRRGYHQMPAHLDAMVDRIMADDHLGTGSGGDLPPTPEAKTAVAGD